MGKDGITKGIAGNRGSSRKKAKGMEALPLGAKGRSSIAKGMKTNPVSPTRPHTAQEQLSDVNRGVTAGGGNKHRGDRRDTSKTYSTNQRHASRGSNIRSEVKTRKRSPSS